MITVEIDKFGIPIYNSRHILESMLCGDDDLITLMQSDPNDKEIQKFNIVAKDKGISEIPLYQTPDMTIKEFDQLCQSHWFMPDTYINLDIKEWIIRQTPEEEPYFSRAVAELEAFESLNLLDLLKWLKYFVDTCRQNNIVWGVGRGSSVSSYVLFLLGVHKIDPIKFELDWHDFLR